MQLIFPPTCQGKEWERHRPHPGGVYLCYYHRVSCEAFPFFSLLAENLHTQWREIENGMFVSLPRRATEALEKNPRSPFNILFEALEMDERCVIDFASWGLLFLRAADNYERISQWKRQSARLLLSG